MPFSVDDAFPDTTNTTAPSSGYYSTTATPPRRTTRKCWICGYEITYIDPLPKVTHVCNDCQKIYFACLNCGRVIDLNNQPLSEWATENCNEEAPTCKFCPIMQTACLGKRCAKYSNCRKNGMYQISDFTFIGGQENENG